MIKASELSWDDIVRVGPGTLGGNYLRRFWWPVALSEEVKDIPLPVDALGEELVLFRDLSGRVALLGRHCSHRRASLEYGRIYEYDIDKAPEVIHDLIPQLNFQCLDETAS